MAQATVFGQLLTGDSPSSVMRALSPFLLPALLLIVLLRYFSAGAKTSNNKQGKRPPPSPPAMPLIGHLHLVGEHPHVSLRDLAVKHGHDLMLLRFGVVPTLVVSSPSAAQAVLRTQDQSMSSRPRSIFGDMISFGPSNVSFAPYGHKWRQAKKLLTTHMLSAKKVQSYGATRQEQVALIIDQIRSAAMANTAVDMTELLSSFTTDIVARLVAGRSFRDGGTNKKFKEVLDASMILLGGFNLENCYPGLARMGGGVLMWLGRRKAEKVRDRWQELLDMVIDQHMSAAAKAVDGAAPHESDFTDVLLSKQEEYGLDRDGLRGILAEMFAAGTDTSQLVLEFAMAELMMHQDVMAKLQAEVRSIIKPNEVITGENINGMPYLKAVIKETLRLHPPAPLLIPHLTLEECTIDGYVVPAGATVFVNFWAIGRDPRFWDAAEEFKPERFINKGDAFDYTGSDFQYVPFGAGRRICAGADFAMANVEMMLANLVCHFDWDFAGGVTEIDMTEVFGLTVHRKEKLILTPSLPSS